MEANNVFEPPKENNPDENLIHKSLLENKWWVTTHNGHNGINEFTWKWGRQVNLLLSLRRLNSVNQDSTLFAEFLEFTH